VAKQWTSAHELIRKWRAPKEPRGSGIETTTPDCGGLFGAGDQLAHTVRNRALPGKEQFGERFVIAISRDVSHNFPLLHFLLIKWQSQLPSHSMVWEAFVPWFNDWCASVARQPDLADCGSARRPDEIASRKIALVYFAFSSKIRPPAGMAILAKAVSRRNEVRYPRVPARKSARDAHAPFGEPCSRNRLVTYVLWVRLETIAR
jgi:hypothetical protein